MGEGLICQSRVIWTPDLGRMNGGPSVSVVLLALFMLQLNPCAAVSCGESLARLAHARRSRNLREFTCCPSAFAVNELDCR